MSVFIRLTSALFYNIIKIGNLADCVYHSKTYKGKTLMKNFNYRKLVLMLADIFIIAVSGVIVNYFLVLLKHLLMSYLFSLNF